MDTKVSVLLNGSIYTIDRGSTGKKEKKLTAQTDLGRYIEDEEGRFIYAHEPAGATKKSIDITL